MRNNVVIVKFISTDHVHGLLHAEKTVQTRLIAQVKNISKPLAVAKCSECESEGNRIHSSL